MRQSLSALGASNDTLRFVRNAYRAGTQKVYDSRWSRWVSWCELHGVDPIRPQAVDLANFLSHLAAVDGLAPASVKVFRSAIHTSLKQLGGRIRGQTARPSLIKDVVRGIDAVSVQSPRRCPAWDIMVVLEYLRSSAFEPLRSLSRKDLTLKTVFLVMLASGRRCSEVNALSGLVSDIARDRDGAYILRFLPEFRAKNQSAGDRSPSVRIPPLSSILGPDDEDRFLCPVRALRSYLRLISGVRPTGCRKLFLSHNPEYQKDVSVSTTSRWVSEVIKRAYAASGAEVLSTRAHEVRAWSASLAFAHSIALKDIMEAAFWKSESTFSDFYLRDASFRRLDGSSGISTLAVSQTTVSLQ